MVPGTGTQKILVCDLAPGLYAVRIDDAVHASCIEATGEGACVYFDGPPGNYRIGTNDVPCPDAGPGPDASRADAGVGHDCAKQACCCHVASRSESTAPWGLLVVFFPIGIMLLRRRRQPQTS